MNGARPSGAAHARPSGASRSSVQGWVLQVHQAHAACQRSRWHAARRQTGRPQRAGPEHQSAEPAGVAQPGHAAAAVRRHHHRAGHGRLHRAQLGYQALRPASTCAPPPRCAKRPSVQAPVPANASTQRQPSGSRLSQLNMFRAIWSAWAQARSVLPPANFAALPLAPNDGISCAPWRARLGLSSALDSDCHGGCWWHRLCHRHHTAVPRRPAGQRRPSSSLVSPVRGASRVR